jgi:predicted methyltransferase MtxX (methanogen marker protein 4)
MTDDTAFDGFIRDQAAAGRRRIGIGILRPDAAVVASLTQAQTLCELITFGQEVAGIPCVPTATPEDALVVALEAGDLDAVVRGQANATILRQRLVERLGCRFEDIKDLAVIKDNLGRVFILCPVAHAQGWTVDQKVALIIEAVKLARLLRLPVKVGVTSGARPEEVGPIPYLAESFAEAEEIVARLGADLPIRHYYVDVDQAIADRCSILVMANGMVGNQVLRALVFLGQVRIYGGIVGGIAPLVEESFRNSAGFFGYLEFANALANLRGLTDTSHNL